MTKTKILFILSALSLLLTVVFIILTISQSPNNSKYIQWLGISFLISFQFITHYLASYFNIICNRFISIFYLTANIFFILTGALMAINILPIRQLWSFYIAISFVYVAWFEIHLFKNKWKHSWIFNVISGFIILVHLYIFVTFSFKLSFFGLVHINSIFISASALLLILGVSINALKAKVH